MKKCVLDYFILLEVKFSEKNKNYFKVITKKPLFN